MRLKEFDTFDAFMETKNGEFSITPISSNVYGLVFGHEGFGRDLYKNIIQNAALLIGKVDDGYAYWVSYDSHKIYSIEEMKKAMEDGILFWRSFCNETIGYAIIDNGHVFEANVRGIAEESEFDDQLIELICTTKMSYKEMFACICL